MNNKSTTTTPDVIKDARQLYQAHRSAASKRSKVENLDKLWQALNEIRENNGRDYCLAEVGRRLEKVGGPKTQSLRNAQGVQYREIISAYAAAVSGSTRYVAKTKSNVEQALDLISDPSVRATIRVALDEVRRLKVVNDNLHSAFKLLKVGTNLPSQKDAVETTSSSMPRPNAQVNSLPPRLLNALRKGIDSSRLAQQGLRIADDGSIENEKGDKIFPPSFSIAIHSILDTKG